MKISVNSSVPLKQLAEEVMPLLSDFVAGRRSSRNYDLVEKVAILRDALKTYEGTDKDEIISMPVHGNNLGGYITYATGVGATKLKDALVRFDDTILEGREPELTVDINGTIKNLTLPDGIIIEDIPLKKSLLKAKSVQEELSEKKTIEIAPPPVRNEKWKGPRIPERKKAVDKMLPIREEEWKGPRISEPKKYTPDQTKFPAVNETEQVAEENRAAAKIQKLQKDF